MRELENVGLITNAFHAEDVHVLAPEKPLKSVNGYRAKGNVVFVSNLDVRWVTEKLVDVYNE